jgi:hypothetical protein
MKHIKLFESYSKEIVSKFKQATRSTNSSKTGEMRKIILELTDDFLAGEDWLEDSDFRDTAIEVFLNNGLFKKSHFELLKLLKPTKTEINKIINSLEKIRSNMEFVLECHEKKQAKIPTQDVEKIKKVLKEYIPASLQKLRGML